MLSRHANKIVELIGIDEKERDAGWLLQSLQAAIELEHATLPPYLCGLWSIVEQSGAAYDLINSVVLQEMLHMGLACNLLTTIGGKPAIDTPNFVPKYPGYLPGGVRPELVVHMQGLTREYVANVFMQIEAPAFAATEYHKGHVYPSIGEFYDAVLRAYKKLVNEGAVRITGDHQVSSNLGSLNTIYPINTLQDVEDAITEIKQQGEGSSKSPDTNPEDFDNRDRQQVSHYFKFAEIYHGRQLTKVDGHWEYAGAAIPFPETLPVAPIPPGGYPQVSRPFDQLYSQMLNNLHNAWNENPDRLNEAVRIMRLLRQSARELMQRHLPDGDGNYGPSFLYVPD